MAFVAKHPGVSAERAAAHVRDELAAAHGLLSGGRAGDAEIVHDARRAITRARGELRLIAPKFSEVRRQIDGSLRAALHELAPARDAEATLEACAALRRHARCDQERASLERLAARVAQHALRADLGEACGHLDAAREACWRFEGLVIDHADPDGALARCYRRCRRRLRVARATRSAIALHAWRRQLRHLRTHLTLLSESDPGSEPLRVARARAHRLATTLGDHHDLTLVLRAARSLPHKRDRKRIRRAVRRREQALRRKAFARGRRLFADRPRRAVGRWLGSAA
ncbi:MAG: CHAD domain-containing protein [Phycisphaerales bacterium]